MTPDIHPPAAASPRITIDDVRTALGDTDPHHTNASKVRTLLGGRGSFETIQKHLNSLRQALASASAPPVAVDAMPGAPTLLIDQVWATAWTAAQMATMRRTETLVGERDATLAELATLEQDVAGLVATVDEQAAQLERAAQATDAALAEQLKAETALAALALALQRSQAELAQTKADAAHAGELAEQGRVMMRAELGRLTDQIGELKAHLYQRPETGTKP